MATGYTRIGSLLIPYEKPDPKPAAKKKVEPAPETTPVDVVTEEVQEVTKPKRRRGRPRRTEGE